MSILGSFAKNRCPLIGALVALGAIVVPSAATGDTVWVRQPDGELQRRGGDIVEFRSDFVTLRRSKSNSVRIPTERVERWEATLSGAHQRADASFRAGDWQAAQSAYEDAMQRESREWVQRLQLARVIWCERNRGDDLSAVRHFLILLRSDDSMVHLDAAPLHWKTRPVTGAARQWATEHLHDETFPVSRLIAASWLLGGSKRVDALQELQRLSAASERRIALLATMQLWRAKWPAGNDSDLQQADRRVRELPEQLRAGGCYVIAQEYKRRGDLPSAAKWWLRVGLLYQHDAILSSDALWRAGDALQESGDADGAKRLFFELVDRFPTCAEAAEARKRLK